MSKNGINKVLTFGVTSAVLFSFNTVESEKVVASWYHEGSKTANGEKYKPDGLTAAHRTLPFGTVVTVKNPKNNKSVKVRINDRGPYIDGRSIDLSRGAAKVLGMIDEGIQQVFIEYKKI